VQVTDVEEEVVLSPLSQFFCNISSPPDIYAIKQLEGWVKLEELVQPMQAMAGAGTWAPCCLPKAAPSSLRWDDATAISSSCCSVYTISKQHCMFMFDV